MSDHGQRRYPINYCLILGSFAMLAVAEPARKREHEHLSEFRCCANSMYSVVVAQQSKSLSDSELEAITARGRMLDEYAKLSKLGEYGWNNQAREIATLRHR